MKYDIMLTGVYIVRGQLYQSNSNGLSTSGNLLGDLLLEGSHILHMPDFGPLQSAGVS